MKQSYTKGYVFALCLIIFISVVALPSVPAAGPNLALSRPITANNYTQSYVATNANDGNVNTYWEGAPNAYPNTLTVDLGSSQTINNVVVKLNSSWGARTQTFAVLGSTNGSTYTTLVGSATYTFNPATNSNTVSVTFNNSSQRYVRLNFTANSGATGGQVAEFEVYGPDATGTPDLIVTDITMSPANPAPGNAVRFSAVVRNQGTGAIPGGTIIGVSFLIDGTQVNWSDTYTSSLAAGASVTLTANSGPSGSATWTATAGTHTVTAWVDDVNRIPNESNENNNQYSESFTVGSTATATPTPTRAATATPTPPPSTKVIPGKIEAENYDAMSGIQTEVCSEGTQNVGWIDANDWLDYNVTVQSTGAYRIDYRVASPNTTGRVDFRIGGTTLASTAIPNTGGWQSWTTVSANVTLNAGAQTIRLFAGGTGWNINWFQGIAGGATATPTQPPATATPTPTPPPGGGTPDLIVTDIISNPASPLIGNAVTFSAVVKNQGNGYTPAGTIIGVSFSVDGTQVSWSDTYTTALAPGASVTLISNSGPSGSATWTATAGSHTVNAWVDDVNRMAESDENNNRLDKYFTIYSGPTPTPGPTPIPPVGKSPLASMKASDLLGAIPGANSNTASIGATMPYKRYDSKAAAIGGGAALATSTDFNRMNIATQASEQSYVRLPSNGSYAEWTMNTTGAGVTMRFTMPDSSDGMGRTGSLDVYVNGSKVKTVNLSSYWMWQYFAGGNPSDTNDGGAPLFAFDEVHFALPTALKSGDKLRIQSSGASSLEYGVDFVEVEDIPAQIQKPTSAYSVTDFGATPNDGVDDLTGILNCVAAANRDQQDVYFPAGTYHMNQIWYLYASNIRIMGAGKWYTNLQFTNSAPQTGGISGGNAASGNINDGNCKNVWFSDMYINSNLRSRYNQQAIQKCFMDVWTGCVIDNIWEDHFECGFWFGDYNGAMNYSDGVIVSNSRIRNNLADGVNFCQGTSNATVYNCSVRNNGDDGLAMWNNNWGGAKDETNNKFCYNTIEFIWRAGGIAIYGGSGHQIYNNYIIDTVMSAGIHLNTIFDGYKFTNNTGMSFTNNILVRTGTIADSWGEDLSAIDIKGGTINNLTFTNNYVYNSQQHGIRIFESPSNISFNNTDIFGTGFAGQTSNYSSVPIKGCLFRFNSEGATPALKINGLDYANIAMTAGPTTPGVYGNLSACTITNMNNLGNSYTFTIPIGTNKW